MRYLFSGFKSWMLAAASITSALLGAYLYGVSQTRRKEAEERGIDYMETRKRIDEADDFNDPSVAREWLRNRDQ